MPSDLYSIVASLLTLMYEDNIETENSLSVWDLMKSRLKLFQDFEQWRHGLDPSFAPLHDDTLKGVLVSNSNISHFRLALSIHYFRALMLLNGPVLTKLLDCAVSESVSEAESQMLFEQCIPVIRHETSLLQDAHKVLFVSSTKGESFLDQSNAWWLCNHAGKWDLHHNDVFVDFHQLQCFRCIYFALYYFTMYSPCSFRQSEWYSQMFDIYWVRVLTICKSCRGRVSCHSGLVRFSAGSRRSLTQSVSEIA